MLNHWAIILTVLLIGTIVLLSWYARRFTQNAADFYLAGRKIGIFTNASAICGDYFSAASFLGVAAAVYASGLDGIWFGTGFGAAFFPVLVFIASAMQRFGEYTIPDFLAARFQSDLVRIIGIFMVQATIIIYLAPQMVGAGTTWQILVNKGIGGLTPYNTGVIVVSLVMMLYVGVGGMKGTTWNQMLQFWLLMTVMLSVVILGLNRGFRYPSGLAQVSKDVLTAASVVSLRDLIDDNAQDHRSPLYKEAVAVMSRESIEKLDAAIAAGDLNKKVTIVLPQKNKLHPERVMKFNEPGHRFGWLDQYSVVLALVLGTASLPHIMNRYYTSPSGRVARLTTVWVLGLVAAFYMMGALVGAIGRQLVPELMRNGTMPSDMAVDGLLLNPDTLMPVLGKYLGGELGLGFVAAGAFAAMFSTIGGLLMASAATWGHDLYEHYINPNAPEWKKVAVGRFSVVIMSFFSLIIGIWIPASNLDKAYPSLIAMMVTWAFAVSGAAFVPALVISIWWKKVTMKGAVAGMLVGGLGSVFFIFLNILHELKITSPNSLWRYLGSLTFPTIIVVPISITVVIVVSLLDQKNLPTNIEQIWIRIHGTARERLQRKWEHVGVYQDTRFQGMRGGHGT